MRKYRIRIGLTVAWTGVLSLAMACAAGQGTTKPAKYKTDTLRLTEKRFKRTVAYTYRTVVFYVDYDDFVRQLEDETRDEYLRVRLEETREKLLKDIIKSDTVFITQATFDEIPLIPFDSFLIGLIEHNRCVIRDLKHNFLPMVVRVEFLYYYKPGVWGGRRYFLPNSKTFLIEVTDIVS